MAVSDATWLDQAGHVRLVGQLDGDFGGLPTGWTEDVGDPANVQTNGGQLALGDTGNEYEITAGPDGFFSAPADTAFTASDDQGATVALDGGGLLLSNVVPDGTITYVSTAAAAPTTFTTPLYYDSTAVTGGLYAWDGTAYVHVSAVV